ncbi:MAG: sodium/solute symporter [Sedimentisphaerales bacterium]|nr:sodium/solute symporter [Sedimentisphaerales bacterium]
MITPTLTKLDWIVIAAYGLGMLAIGGYYARKTRDAEDYLLGGRKMNPTAVGLSLFATLMSTLSYLAYPGEMIKHGPMVFAGLVSFPLVYYIAGYYLIPRFMPLNVTSAYEILETRFGLSVRLMGTFFFLCLRFLWMAMIIFTMARVVLVDIFGLKACWIPVLCLVMGLVTLAYTSLGGLRAVVITDVIQTVILFLGAGLTLLIIVRHFQGLGGCFPEVWPEHWDKWHLGLHPQGRMTGANAMLMMFTWYICTAGSDQMAIQRYLATRDVRAARKTMAVSLGTNFLVHILLALVGLALLAYFTAKPQLLPDGQSVVSHADMLFTRFIVVGLPTGLSGLVIAGLLAAAMSSLSSGVNSAASVISRDVWERFSRKSFTPESQLKRLRWLSVCIGLTATILSLALDRVEGNLLDMVIKVVNLFVGPLFVLFFLALFVPFANTPGALIGGAVSVVIAVAIGYFEVFQIGISWMVFLALTGGVGVGIVGSLVATIFHAKKK